MAYLGKWAEHVWTRMRRLDYWNPEHVINNLPAKGYRRVSPGSQPLAHVPHKAQDAVYSIRYFPRDAKRRDTDYYPDTPLSLNHNLMKGKPIRCERGSPFFGLRVIATPPGMLTPFPCSLARRPPRDPPSQLPKMNCFDA
jgi:hypothetical protein